MTRRTYTKRTRAFNVVKDITGKVRLEKRDTLSAPTPRQLFEVDCGEAGFQVLRVSPGQTINPVKFCKRFGGNYIPHKAEEKKD